MKPYRRRQQATYPFYKLAMWSERSMCWLDLSTTYVTKGLARNAALNFGDGRYRISKVDEDGRTDLDPFKVGD